jgi:cobaltochelatase CobN
MLYGALDNDDFFMYMGGLATAVRSIDGKSPELVVTNTRDPGKPEMSSIDKFIGSEFRSRYVNPAWIEGMKKEGYAGAGEMRAFVEYLWGWEATVPEAVDDRMWQETFEVYVDDKRDLGMKEFFDKNSPFAYQDMTARMVETVRKGYWKADAATETRLISEYLESVETFGVGCAEHTCGNARLSQYILERGRALGIPVPALDGFQQAMERVTAKSIADAARQLNEFVQKNEARIESQWSSLAEPVPGQATAAKLAGYLMEVREQNRAAVSQAVRSSSGVEQPWEGLWVGLPVLGFLLVLRWRRA